MPVVYKHKFKVGDSVSWTSQAGGSWKPKVGTVIEVVPSDHPPTKYAGTSTRGHESYVVKVAGRPAKTSKGSAEHVRVKDETYWPVRSQLEPAKGSKFVCSKPKKEPGSTTGRSPSRAEQPAPGLSGEGTDADAAGNFEGD